MLTIYADGLCEPVNPGGHACYGWSAQDDTGAEIATDHGHLLSGPAATNNLAEYGAVIKALRYAQSQGWMGVRIRTDSQLVANQLTGEWGCNAEGLVKYLSAARKLVDEIGAVIEWVPREQNGPADKLSRLAYMEMTGHMPPERSATGQAK